MYPCWLSAVPPPHALPATLNKYVNRLCCVIHTPSEPNSTAQPHNTPPVVVMGWGSCEQAGYQVPSNGAHASLLASCHSHGLPHAVPAVQVTDQLEEENASLRARLGETEAARDEAEAAKAAAQQQAR